MDDQKFTDVMINGKVYKLRGHEDEAYLQKVASYLNGKIGELKQVSGYYKITPEMQAILLQINIANDYFSLKERAKKAELSNSEMSKNLYTIKHELISTKLQLDELKRKYDSLKESNKK